MQYGKTTIYMMLYISRKHLSALLVLYSYFNSQYFIFYSEGKISAFFSLKIHNLSFNTQFLNPKISTQRFFWAKIISN